MKTSLVAKLTMTAMLASLITLSIGLPAHAGRFAQNHPRRAEVLHRDGNLRRSTNADKGHLGGHYGQLRSEEKGIHQQERADKNANGGYITKGQKQQLNQEETGVRQQIRQDRTN